MNSPIFNPYCVEARYTEQRIPQFRDNALIAALPPIPSDEQLAEELFELPEFSVEQRDWSASERLCMVAELAHLLRPLQRHLSLARAFDTLMRTGYSRRGIRSKEHIETYQRLYEAKQEGRAFPTQSKRKANPQLSSALIGLPGTGKTTTVRRIFLRYPEAILHSDGVMQIPYLHIECPHDGISVKGLALSILRKLDLLVPDANYFQLYKPSLAADVLLNHCARALHNHYVGVLVIDEIQNLRNAGKTNGALMASLVTSANELSVPVVFAGTMKALKALGVDASVARRSSGAGFPTWDALSRSGDLNEPGEWEDLISTLWPFQWLQKPVELDDVMSNFMYECCQGIPDFAVKLFMCAQWRGVLDGTETFSIETLAAIMSNELSRVAPIVDALKTGDIDARCRYEDITPPEFTSLLDDALNAYEGVRQRGAALTADNPALVPRVASILVEAGINEDRAFSMASKVAKEGKAVGLVDATSAALKLAKPPAPVRGKKKRAIDAAALVELAPDDYRNAIHRASESDTTTFDELVAMGAARPLHELLGYV
ncbi:transposase [Paraburkholderia bannensis]|uniref:AAA domain-containing protein n=1 Tax=Paraburkholderia tropica TaxID=92647 RepID=A0AAQ1GD93_9BURK|nr:MULTISPECIES: AAA family ATPase [Paraburkholderia]RQM50959.1 transposase [Paraburkholderia bannensis]RQN40311.1 transposase [Paraburkholderia tropica]SEJ33535.1 AAA domain-containing protein [Paraburkholderia tropica]